MVSHGPTFSGEQVYAQNPSLGLGRGPAHAVTIPGTAANSQQAKSGKGLLFSS